MDKLIKTLLLIFVIFLSAGCASTGNYLSQESLTNIDQCTQNIVGNNKTIKIDFVGTLKKHSEQIKSNTDIDKTIKAMILDNPNIPGMQQVPMYKDYLFCIGQTREETTAKK